MDDLWNQIKDLTSGVDQVSTRQDPWTTVQESVFPTYKPAAIQQPQQQDFTTDRNPIMDIPTALIAGVTDLAEQFAKARLAYGGHAGGENIEEDDYVGKFANWLVENKQQFEKSHPYLYAPDRDEGAIRKALREGLRSIIPSVGAGVPGAVLGTVAGAATGVPFAGTVAGYAASGGTIFGLAEYDQFIRDVKEYNAAHPDNPIPASIYKDKALKSAILEGGLESVSDAIEAGTFGFGKLMTKPVKETLSSILKTGWKGGAKDFLTRQLVTQPAEIGTEMAQNYSETALRNQAGLEQRDPWDAAVEAIGPTFVSTLLIGAGTHTFQAYKRGKIVKALENPEADFEDRFEAMKTVYRELQEFDKANDTDLASKWGKVAQYKLLNNEAIDIDENVIKMKPLEGLLADRKADAELRADEAKFMERGKKPTPEELKAAEEARNIDIERPADDKQVRQIMGYETRDLLYKGFLNKGFSEERANELAALVMGAREPQTPVKPTEKSIILDSHGNPFEKEVLEDSTSDTITLSRGQSIISNLPENIKNQFILTGRGATFTSPGAAKAVIKKAGKSETHQPFMIAPGEWIGAPASFSQTTSDLTQITAGRMQRPVEVVSDIGASSTSRGPVEQTPVNPSLAQGNAQQPSNIYPDDLTNKGAAFTNKVSAMRAIQKHYKEMNYTGTAELFVPVQIGEKQWVARRKSNVSEKPAFETPRQYVNRRNAEYLEASKESPRKGLEKLDEIISGMEEEGHDKSPAYEQIKKRREKLAESITRASSQREKTETKEEKTQEDVANEAEINEEINTAQPAGTAETKTVVPETESEGRESNDTGDTTQQENKTAPVKGESGTDEIQSKTKSTIEELNKASSNLAEASNELKTALSDVKKALKEKAAKIVQGSETSVSENKVSPAKKAIEKLRAKAVIARLKAGEDVPDADVQKFKTVALRWKRNAEGKWEEHEPEYLSKRTMTPEERERRADQRALTRQRTKIQRTKTPIELAKAAKKRLLSLKNKILKTNDPEELIKLQDEIDATRRDMHILANRALREANIKKPIDRAYDHQFGKHLMFQPAEQAKEQIENLTVFEPETGIRLLKKMNPVNMPKALVTMINYNMHFQDGTINLHMVDQFLKQLKQGLKAGKLDNYLKETDDKANYLAHIELAQSYLKDTTDWLVSKGTLKLDGPSFNRQTETSGPGLSVNKCLEYIDELTKSWPNAPFTIVVENREQLPDYIKSFITEADNNNRIGGVYYEGTTFIIANENRNKEGLFRVLLHENVGHFGIYETLGNDLKPTLIDIYNSFKNDDSMKEIIEMYAFNVNNETDQAKAGSEFIAKMAEDGIGEKSLWEKITQAIMKVLRSWGITHKLTTGDVKDLLADSMKFVRGERTSAYNIEDFMSKELEPRPDRINNPPPFYSELLRVLQTRTDMPTKPQSLLNWLNKYVKPAELKWMDIQGFLKGKVKINKQDLINYVSQNLITLDEKIKTEYEFNYDKVYSELEKFSLKIKEKAKYSKETPEQFTYRFFSECVSYDDYNYIKMPFFKEFLNDNRITDQDDFIDEANRLNKELRNYTDNNTLYGKYTLLGGKNYKELLFMWQPPTSEELLHYKVKYDHGFYLVIDENGNIYSSSLSKAQAEYEAEKLNHDNLVALSTKYKSGHWRELNVIGHVRFNERLDGQGRRVLFLEELQSDWLQDAKKYGFKDITERRRAAVQPMKVKEIPDDFARMHATTDMGLDEDDVMWVVFDPYYSDFVASALTENEAELIGQNYMDSVYGNTETDGVYPAPFLENWHEVFMKRMIRYAADNDFDAIAWTTGKQQADRYDLVKHIDSLTVQKRAYDKSYLITAFKDNQRVLVKDAKSDKELRELIGEDLGNKAIKQLNKDYDYEVDFSGLDLKIGGKGMAAFYDQKLSNFVERYIKQWGAKLGKVEIPDASLIQKKQHYTVNDFPYAENDDKYAYFISSDRRYTIGYDYDLDAYFVELDGAKLYRNTKSSIVNVINQHIDRQSSTEREDFDWRPTLQNDIVIYTAKVSRGKYTIYPDGSSFSLFFDDNNFNTQFLGNFDSLDEATHRAEQEYKPKMLQQPGFILTNEMKKSVVEKGQPWFVRYAWQGSDNDYVRMDNAFLHTGTGRTRKGEGQYVAINEHEAMRYPDPRGATYVHKFAIPDHMEFLDLDKIITEKHAKMIADALEPYRRRDQRAEDLYQDLVNPESRELRTGEEVNNSLRYMFGDHNASRFLREKAGIHGAAYVAEGTTEEHLIIFDPNDVGDRVDSKRVKPEAEFWPSFSKIVDYKETQTKESIELKDLFDDHAYAILKTLHAQLPKNQPAMHAVEKYLLSPEWYKHPVMKKIVDAAIDRHDRYYELFNKLNEFGVDTETNKQITWKDKTNVIDANIQLMRQGLSKGRIIKGDTSQAYQQLEQMLDEIDTGEWREGYAAKDGITWEQHYKNLGFSNEVIELYKQHRRAYDRALELLMEPMQKLADDIDAEAARTKTKPKYPEFTTYDENGNIIKINLKAVLHQMGRLKGTYAPRIREYGEYVVKGSRGNDTVRYHKSTRMAAELLKRQLERKGYKIEPIKERDRLPEDVYSTLRVINTAKAIENAMNGMDVKNPELQAKFNEELLHNVADLIRVRGFRSVMVKRKGDRVVRGYITDPNERYVKYINSVASGIAKAEAAEKMFKHLTGYFEGTGEDKKKVDGIDPSKEPRAYETASRYIEEQLRNSDKFDRLIGFTKSVATFKYLGFSLRAPVVNILSLVTVAPMSIHQYILNGKGSLLKINKAISTASVDYAKVMKGKKLKDVDEQALIEEIQKKGYDSPQYTREALGTIQKSYHKAWARSLEWAMYIFGKSEQWIRGTTILAAYRLAKENNPEISHKEATELAHQASNKAHGIYGKSTQLAVGQGTSPSARIAQTLYTFAKFPHNYLQMLYDIGVRKQNIKGFLYGLLSPVILGGVAVLPFKDTLFSVVQSMLSLMGFGGDDAEKDWWDWFRGLFGETGERVARHGLMGAMNLDVSGSMAIGLSLPSNGYELFGIAGGLTKDMVDMLHFFSTGQYARGAEKLLPNAGANVIRAIRELNGVTTSKGQLVWDKDGNPYVPSMSATLLRAATGFKTADLTTMQERTWETKREIQRYADKRAKILEQWRAYLVNKGDAEDLQEIMDKITEYNDQVIKNDKAGEVPLIKKTTLKNQAKALTKPSKAMAIGMFEQ